MHKTVWTTPVVLYALRGDQYEAYGVAEHLLVRSVPPCLSASHVRDLAACNAEFKLKLMGCAFAALEGAGAYSALGAVLDWDPEHLRALPMCTEESYVYVNLCTYITCYGDGGRLAHAEQLHCATLCMPRAFAAADAARTMDRLRAHRAAVVERVSQCARVVVKQNDSFHYLHASDFSVLKVI